MTFKTTLVALALCITSPLSITTSAAQAADWSGLYLGTQVGGHQFHLENTNVASDSILGGLLKESSVSGGLYTGYNLQSGSFVYGLEANLMFNNASFDVEITQGAQYVKTNLHQKLSGALLGRFGYAHNNFLYYGVAGVAFTELNIDIDINITTRTEKYTRSFSQVGLALGLGLENQITDNLILKAQYLYSGYGDISKPDAKAINFSSHDLMLGLAYKF